MGHYLSMAQNLSLGHYWRKDRSLVERNFIYGHEPKIITLPAVAAAQRRSKHGLKKLPNKNLALLISILVNIIYFFLATFISILVTIWSKNVCFNFESCIARTSRQMQRNH